MAVAPASMADEIILLDGDDDEEESPQPSCSAATSSSEQPANNISPPRRQQPAPTHITESPFASAKKNANVLLAENQKLFSEFVTHCTPLTEDCPEVLTFLHTKHSKACPDFLSSVEFRNTLGRCLTRAQANLSKTFVYINELCTVLKQHAIKKRQSLIQVKPTTGNIQSTSGSLRNKDKTKSKTEEEEDEVKPAEEQPSTSGAPEEDQISERKKNRALRKQIAYLENLLEVYNNEICRLQRAELSLDDLGTEDSSYIQEHKLKRKMMKIYEKLCELKGCNKLTGRVIEQRIEYKGTRYPEINRRIERFINSPEAHRNPPDYPDILQQVLRANERHNLCLSRKQLNQIAQEAFRETGSRMQERRHLDMIFNFGSHLTDSYKTGDDPALSDSSLLRKLRSNREVALSHLDEVITKYAVKQDDTEEQERLRRLERDVKGQKPEDKPEDTTQKKEKEAQEEEVEEDDDEEDESSDPDIEEEIQASTQQDGEDDDEEEEDHVNEAEQHDSDKEDQTYDQTGSLSVGCEGSVKDEDEPLTSPASDDTHFYLTSDIPSLRDSPAQSEPMQTDDQQPLSNGSLTGSKEPVDSSNQLSVVIVRDNQVIKEGAAPSAAATNGDSLPEQETVFMDQSETQTINGTSPPPSPRTTRSQKRKREESSTNSGNVNQRISYDSDADIPLDMGVINCSPPHDNTRAETPTLDLTCSSQSTPPPKKNKVNVATQCDPHEIIVLSDSE